MTAPDGVWITEDRPQQLFLPASYVRKGQSTEEITEAATSPIGRVAVPPTSGFVPDVPMGGTSVWNPGGTQGSASRREFADQLYGAYMACSWASACVDVIARTVTAGGLEITPDDDSQDVDNPPPEVLRLQSLFDFVNPRENMRQLLRGIVTDLLIFGDAFVEIVYLGGLPVALYSLDSPSMIPIADEHGSVTHYTQALDPFRQAEFDPHEVMHFTLDSPRGGVYGIGGIQKALLPITAWLFTAGLIKETMRKGNPPKIHFDYPLEVDRNEMEVDRQKWIVKNLGIANVGNPYFTKGGAHPTDLKANQITEYLETLTQKRDEIIASLGVPPRKLSIAEPGQLGGTGEGATADKTFRVNTCGPLSELVLEVFNFDLLTIAFGISGWSIKIGEVDWRDDQVIENIRDQRLRNGSWTLNRYRQEIDEEPVEGGDDAVLVDRQNLILWSDLAALSHAQTMAANAGVPVPGLPMPDQLVAAAQQKTDGKDAGNPAQESAPGPRSPIDEEAALVEAWTRDYQNRRKKALKELPKVSA